MHLAPGIPVVSSEEFEIWEQTIPRIVDRAPTRTFRCSSCDKLALRGSCVGSRTLESGGDPEGPPDYYCQVAHARVRAFCADLQVTARPAGRRLPLQRERDCPRPWLHEHRPLHPSWLREEPPPRSLPVVS